MAEKLYVGVYEAADGTHEIEWTRDPERKAGLFGRALFAAEIEAPHNVRAVIVGTGERPAGLVLLDAKEEFTMLSPTLSWHEYIIWAHE